MSDRSVKVSAGLEVLTVLLILTVITITYLVGYALWWLLSAASGLSLVIDLPLYARIVGGALVLLGVGVLADVTRYRKLRDILDSTSVTLRKLIRREPIGELGARTEPFVPRGPYRWVRNPMYFGAIMFPFGFGLLLSSVAMLIWGVVLIFWFGGVLVPAEERELDALFGESYRAYKKQVPMLLPTGRRFRGDQPKP